MLENIESVLRDECKLAKDRPVIVGVSGGPDSLCLMDSLRQAGYAVVVAHFNHQLRPEAAGDAQSVEQVALRLGLEFVIGGADVHAHAEDEKLSIEEAARHLRYRFLFRLARERAAQAVAVGHTADDQVETILMHFLRGAGLAGLIGMSPRSIIQTFDPNIPVVRPLLDVRHEETIVYCTAHGLEAHFDSSNDSIEFQRNRIRHQLIPDLESFNPNVRDAILRMSQVLTDDHLLLTESLGAAWGETVTGLGDGAIAFDGAILSKQSPGLQRNLIRRAIHTLCPGLEVDFAAIQRACAFINDPVQSTAVELKGGLRIFREDGKIYVGTLGAKWPFAIWPQMADTTSIPVQVPGEVGLAEGWKFIGQRCPSLAVARGQAEVNADGYQVWLDAGALPDPLELRARRPGDQFEPLGMDGHSQKISDFMVNEKIPQRARKGWPLLCSGETIVWVPGYRPAHRFRLTDSTQQVVHFSIVRPADRLEP